ncbi:hypothetical protein BGZ61DRAFT_236349 [Ilyonectria robusta]|uniref:uncharacterized protein n=1 Tax=Ilyonectria robusta TaxID=1079257 RepID=UPI001E8ECC88|nr:uncharacterized protein BGZ61DRAFT_236349 [Ilyonectria robusta]KAH8699724.1 hypothetical protein BGZ61DRAFT_236349 [Ilyonectria robusta]
MGETRERPAAVVILGRRRPGTQTSTNNATLNKFRTGLFSCPSNTGTKGIDITETSQSHRIKPINLQRLDVSGIGVGRCRVLFCLSSAPHPVASVVCSYLSHPRLRYTQSSAVPERWERLSPDADPAEIISAPWRNFYRRTFSPWGSIPVNL